MTNIYSESNHENSVAVNSLILLVVVYIGRIQELIPGAEELYIGKIAVGLSILLFLITPRTGSSSILSSPLARYVFVIFMFMVISIPFSVWPTASMDFVTMSFIKTLIFFLLLISLVESVAGLEKIAWSFIFSGAILSIALLIKSGDGRLTASSTYDPNDLAFALVIILPLAYFLMQNRSGILKIILAGSIALMLLAFIATASRGGFLGLIAICLGIFYKSGRKLHRAVLPFLAAGILMSAFTPTSFWDRMSTITTLEQDYNIQSQTGRIEIWKRGIKMMLSNPLLGVGVSGFGTAEGTIGGMKARMVAHNSFVQIGAELGVIVFVLFIKLLYGSIQRLRKYRQEEVLGGVPRWLLDGVEVGFYGYIVAGFFLSQAYSSILYLLVAMTIICGKIQARHDQNPYKAFPSTS